VVPSEETCFLLYEAASAELVAQAIQNRLEIRR
jgi:hypothetical protein